MTIHFFRDLGEKTDHALEKALNTVISGYRIVKAKISDWKKRIEEAPAKFQNQVRATFSQVRTAGMNAQAAFASKVELLRPQGQAPENLPVKLSWQERVENFRRNSYKALDRYRDPSTYTRRDFVIIFIVAILLGALIKSGAEKTITIGYEDYRLARAGQLVDLNAAEKQVLNQDPNQARESDVPRGPVCDR